MPPHSVAAMGTFVDRQRWVDMLVGACVGASVASGLLLLLLAEDWLPSVRRRAQRPLEPEPEPQPSKSTLQLVLVLHRHGARYPKKALACDLNWPADEGFWAAHSAEQSADGTLQLHGLGGKLRARYGSWLHEGVARCDMANAVRVLSTNTQRTLNSAWALLGALLPGVPRYIRFPTLDRPDVDWASVERRLAGSGETMGVAIEVESGGTLFHPLKQTVPIDGYDRNEACLASPELKTMAEDPDVQSAADELYAVTGLASLAPSLSSSLAAERVIAMKRLATQLEINSAHGMPRFPTAQPSSALSPDVVRAVQRAGDVVWRHRYRPVQGAHTGGRRVRDGAASAAAGELGRKIAGLIHEKQSGVADKLKLVELSGHTGNLLALAALLGVEVSPPCFAGHWLFELHSSELSSAADWTVRAFYIPDPTQMSQEEYVGGLTPRRLPLDGKYVPYEECPIDTSLCGLTPAKQLIDYLLAR